MTAVKEHPTLLLAVLPAGETLKIMPLIQVMQYLCEGKDQFYLELVYTTKCILAYE